MKKRIFVTGSLMMKNVCFWISASTNKQDLMPHTPLPDQENVLSHHCPTILKKASPMHILCWLLIKKMSLAYKAKKKKKNAPFLLILPGKDLTYNFLNYNIIKCFLNFFLFYIFFIIVL